jgi:multicomponent Na+:H+ antiporter subunit E
VTDEPSQDENAPTTASPAAGSRLVQAHSGPLHLVSLAVILSVFWLLWSGHFHSPLLLGLGAASVVGVTFLCHRMGLVDSHSVPVHLAGRTLTYLPWLAMAVIPANIEVLRRILAAIGVLSLRDDDEPQLIVVQASQTSELGCVSYANSITLTPGTFTLEIEESQLTVHALTGTAAAGLLAGTMDRRVKRFEGEG